MKKALSLTLLVMTISLSACGFTLRGGDRMTAVAPVRLGTQIVLDDNQNQLAFALKQPLVKHLQLLGILEQANSQNAIKVNNLRLRRYELVGTLTEVRLVLMADVSYYLDNTIQHAPIQVEQSYQYNEASVTTLDQQGDKTKTWLYDHLAQRIAEQYYAIAK